MLTRAWRLRLATLIAAGSFAVHQLRFLLAFGSDSSHELSLQGHAYLAVLGPVVGLLMVLALAEFVARLVHMREAESHVPRLRRVWAGATVALLCAYCAQELVEGALASGHPQGLAGVLGAAGWLALPLSLVFGLAIALLMRGAYAAVTWAARRRSRPAPCRARFSAQTPPDWARPVRAPFARHLAGRSPPLSV